MVSAFKVWKRRGACSTFENVLVTVMVCTFHM